MDGWPGGEEVLGVSNALSFSMTLPKPVLVSLAGSNVVISTVRFTNGAPMVFFPKYVLNPEAMKKLLRSTPTNSGMFYRLPRRFDYFPELRCQDELLRGGGVQAGGSNAIGASQQSESAQQYSYSFFNRSDEDYFGLYCLTLQKDRAKKYLGPMVVTEVPCWPAWFWEVFVPSRVIRVTTVPLRCMNSELATGSGYAFFEVTAGTGSVCGVSSAPTNTVNLQHDGFYIVAACNDSKPQLSPKAFVDVEKGCVRMCCYTAASRGSAVRGGGLFNRIADDTFVELNAH